MLKGKLKNSSPIFSVDFSFFFFFSAALQITERLQRASAGGRVGPSYKTRPNVFRFSLVTDRLESESEGRWILLFYLGNGPI